MVVLLPSKQKVRVRFSYPAPFSCGSMVERTAVNRDVGGSNPPARAKHPYPNGRGNWLRTSTVRVRISLDAPRKIGRMAMQRFRKPWA